MQLDPLRHHQTSLTAADQLDDVISDVRARDPKHVTVDVIDQAGMQRDIAVCIMYDIIAS